MAVSNRDKPMTWMIALSAELLQCENTTHTCTEKVDESGNMVHNCDLLWVHSSQFGTSVSCAGNCLHCGCALCK